MAMDPRIDAYIAAQADFARPILDHIRALMHAASPDMGEAVKWGMPFFTYKDQNLANMAAFKGHAAFGFWHDKVGREDASDDAMGQFGRLTVLSDLPSDAAIAGLIAQAMALIDAGDRPRTGPKPPKAPLPVHPAFADAIAANSVAAAIWATKACTAGIRPVFHGSEMAARCASIRARWSSFSARSISATSGISCAADHKSTRSRMFCGVRVSGA
jgi:hypothetical protein